MPEYALTRNYLDLMVELPWSKSTKGKESSPALHAINGTFLLHASSVSLLYSQLVNGGHKVRRKCVRAVGLLEDMSSFLY